MKQFILLIFILQATVLSAQVPQTPAPKKKPLIRLNELKRIGAVCKDGTRSSATGTGACSAHGGVRYWLYTEAPVYESYSENLPAIPDNQLIPLTPDDVQDLVRIQPTPFPLLPPQSDKVPTKKRRSKKRDKEAEEYEEEETTEEEDTEKHKKKSVRHRANDKDEKTIIVREDRWQVIDFLMPFVLLVAVGFMFVLAHYIYRKLL